MSFWWKVLAFYCIVSLLICLLLERVFRLADIPYIYPPWLKEIHVTFYWFSLVFHTLFATYQSHAEKNEYLRDKKLFVGYLFMTHLISANVLRFAFNQGIVVSYIGTLIITAIVPFYAFVLVLHPLWNKRQAADRLSAETVKEIALKNYAAKKFIQMFRHYKTFVYDHAVKNEVATCLLHHRRQRNERPDMMEDILLEVAVDLKTKSSIEDGTRFSRYVFNFGEEGSSVLRLPDFEDLDELNLDEPLDNFTLDRYDTLVDRFPSLKDEPLNVVTLPGPYERVE